MSGEVMDYAIVEIASGLVVNVTRWDGVSDWSAPEGHLAVPLSGGAGIGWGYDTETGTYSPPAEL